MKASKKLKIAGFTVMSIAVLVCISAFIFVRTSLTGIRMSPNLFLLFLGSAIFIVSLILIILGFSPDMAKFGASLQSETMDYAGKQVTEATTKTADVYAPAITKVVRSVKDGIVSSTYCKQCGANIDKDSRFCSKCGKEQ